MKKYIFILALFTLVAGLCLADSPVAMTLRMRGDISLFRAELESKLQDGLPLINQDLLNSKEDSFAFIKFVDDGATLRLFENTILTINSERVEERMNKSSFLRIGNLFANINGRRGNYDIETPTTVASVKGTEGFIEVEVDGTTYIITLKGVFEVENTISGRRADVPAGYTGKSTPNGEIDVYQTEEIDEEWLDAIADMPDRERNTLQIEIVDPNDELKIIEIELE